jgi:hypothetical protein
MLSDSECVGPAVDSWRFVPIHQQLGATAFTVGFNLAHQKKAESKYELNLIQFDIMNRRIDLQTM